MKNPIQWTAEKISSSLEREVEVFETFREHDHRGKRKDAKEKTFSVEGLVFKLTEASRIPASRRLLIGTYLAIMVFWALIFLEAWHVYLLHQPEPQLISAILGVVSFIAGTYWGRHA
jgi:hypothetical protein